MTSRATKSDHLNDSRLIEAVRGSADQIWQAGLGAFAKAQHEGEEMFEKMVQDGVDVQRRIQQRAGDRLTELTDTLTKIAGELRAQASASWTKLENSVEERMSKSLHRLGVPTRDDITALGTQIREIQKSVNALAGIVGNGKQAAKKTAVKGTTARSTKSNGVTKTVKPGRAGTSVRTSSRRGSTSATSSA